MGFIADLAAQARKGSFPGTNQGKETWQQIFGGTHKENKREVAAEPRSGAGGWGRSAANSTAMLRLIQAMRSDAPGGWSDDRWEQSKHFNGIAYVCIHRKSEQLSQAEFQVFHKDPTHPDGKRPASSSHPLVRLLERPNRDDSFGDMMYRWNQQSDLTGKALTWMLPNELSVPFEMYSIPTAIAIPQPVINPEYPHGFYRIQPVYPYGPFSSYPTPTSSAGAPIPAEWMMEFKYPHPLLRYDGYSPLTALRLHLDEVESIDRSRWYTMKRTIRPSAVLNLDEVEGMAPLIDAEVRRIHAEWEASHMGDENAGNLIVGTPGGKIEPWGALPVDLDYSDGWSQLVDFAMAGFGITKPAAGMVEDSSYSTLFATLKQLHLLTLQPFCNRVASRLTRRLACFFGDDLIVEIRCPRIDDHDVKEAKLRLLMDGKVITKNQLLRELDMPITKEAWGEELVGAEEARQQQMMGGGEQGPGGGPRPPDVSGQETPEDARPEPPEITKNRPKTGNLGAGALGPRKGLPRHSESLSMHGRNGRH